MCFGSSKKHPKEPAARPVNSVTDPKKGATVSATPSSKSSVEAPKTKKPPRSSKISVLERYDINKSTFLWIP
ncbi:hypothetical protein M426DRAFT_6964 [Hypoxylon sp. CI-4A]|nr:hypothetical protein M426DRAFT_6964 [Hypoxylon sp. CI-4A]